MPTNLIFMGLKVVAQVNFYFIIRSDVILYNFPSRLAATDILISIFIFESESLFPVYYSFLLALLFSDHYL